MNINLNYQNSLSFGKLKIKQKVEKEADDFTKDQLNLAKPTLEKMAKNVDIIVETRKNEFDPDFNGLKISVREEADSRIKEWMWEKAPSISRKLIRKDEIFQTISNKKYSGERILSKDEGYYTDETFKDALVRTIILPKNPYYMKATEIAFFPKQGETYKDIIRKVREAKILLLEELEKNNSKTTEK